MSMPFGKFQQNQPLVAILDLGVCPMTFGTVHASRMRCNEEQLGIGGRERLQKSHSCQERNVGGRLAALDNKKPSIYVRMKS
jgi:hypothetical protein